MPSMFVQPARRLASAARTRGAARVGPVPVQVPIRIRRAMHACRCPADLATIVAQLVSTRPSVPFITTAAK
jgi:hypothetical protein